MRRRWTFFLILTRFFTGKRYRGTRSVILGFAVYRGGSVETEGFARKRCARSVYTFTAAAKRHVAAWGIAPDALASTRVCSARDLMQSTPAEGRQNSVEHRGAA